MTPFSVFYVEDTFFDPTTLEARFRYSFDHQVYFEERIDFSAPKFSVRQDIDPMVLENLLFHCSFAIGISYYKLYPTKKLIVSSGKIDDFQKSFWQKFYLQGLGEFLYENQISPEGLFDFVGAGERVYEKKSFEPRKIGENSPEYLVPIGGGKDSIVSMELLQKEGKSYDLFTFGKDYFLHHAVANASELRHMIIHRYMDEKLFQMNREGYYNGHVPITGIIAFVLQIVNYLYGYRYNVLSNEKSADIENLIWKGYTINHQYSKSSEFETDFQGYVAKYMSDTLYFSLLRDMYEIEIAKLFSQAKRYFPVFSSCNNNFKVIEQNKTTTDRWCLHCPKCAFVFSVLYPFITKNEVLMIFGRDIYNDESLLSLFQELLGYSGHKPFECVGTNEEVIFSMYLSVELYLEDGRQLPFILDFFHTTIAPTLSFQYMQGLREKFHMEFPR